jgi:hypothetical protein
MNIIKLSNLFNIISIMIGAKWYHFGAESDINRNIANNFDPDGYLGKEYPAIIFEYPVGRWLWGSQNREQQFDVIVNFFDLFGRGNDGQADGLTEGEKFRALDVLVSQFIDLFRSLMKSGQSGGAGIAGDSVNIEYMPFVHNDQLLQITARFTVTFARECTNPDFTNPVTVAAAVAALDPAYVLPLLNSDYEKIRP